MKRKMKLKLHRETVRDLNEREMERAEGGIYPPRDPSMYNSCVASACGCSVYCTYTLY